MLYYSNFIFKLCAEDSHQKIYWPRFFIKSLDFKYLAFQILTLPEKESVFGKSTIYKTNMFFRSRFSLFTQRGGGTATSRGIQGVGDYGVMISPDKAPGVPRHLKERFRLEKQKHIKEEDAEASARNMIRPRQYTVCTKCGISSLVINFDAVPSARIGMYGVCENGKDYTHHAFRVISKQDYERMQDLSKKERLQWLFQQHQ